MRSCVALRLVAPDSGPCPARGFCLLVGTFFCADVAIKHLLFLNVNRWGLGLLVMCSNQLESCFSVRKVEDMKPIQTQTSVALAGVCEAILIAAPPMGAGLILSTSWIGGTIYSPWIGLGVVLNLVVLATLLAAVIETRMADPDADIGATVWLMYLIWPGAYVIHMTGRSKYGYRKRVISGWVGAIVLTFTAVWVFVDSGQRVLRAFNAAEFAKNQIVEAQKRQLEIEAQYRERLREIYGEP